MKSVFLDTSYVIALEAADKTYSLTDCTSFVIMEQRGIEESLSFDVHFEQAGFRRVSAGNS